MTPSAMGMILGVKESYYEGFYIMVLVCVTAVCEQTSRGLHFSTAVYSKWQIFKMEKNMFIAQFKKSWSELFLSTGT